MSYLLLLIKLYGMINIYSNKSYNYYFSNKRINHTPYLLKDYDRMERWEDLNTIMTLMTTEILSDTNSPLSPNCP